jgi:hypothetical protein
MTWRARKTRRNTDNVAQREIQDTVASSKLANQARVYSCQEAWVKILRTLGKALDAMARARASPNPPSGLPYTDQGCYYNRNKYNVHAREFPGGLKSIRNRPDADWTSRTRLTDTRQHRIQDSGQGKGLKSAASRNGRLPGGLARDWSTRRLEMGPSRKTREHSEKEKWNAFDLK